MQLTAEPTSAAAAEQQVLTIGPEDPRYADLTRGCNQRFVSKPDQVYLIRSTADAVRAVQEAVDAGRQLAIRSGGHCQESLVDSGEVRALLDMSELRAVEFDPERRAFSIEPGLTLGEMYRTLFKKWGVTLPGGSCPSVGIGGHIAGGAYGPLSRRLGYLVDYLCGVEVVVVDADGTARAVTATDAADDPNRELWWAHTGGGGGNFGVVTKYWLRTPGARGRQPGELLPRPPQSVLLGYVVWPWEGMDEANFSRLVKNYVTWYERNSDADSPYLDLYSGLLLPHRSAGGIIMNVQMDAGAPNAAELFRKFGEAVLDGVTVLPVVVEQRELPWYRATLWNGLYTSGGLETQRSKVKAADMRARYSDEQVATIYRYLTTTEYSNPTAALMFVGLGGMVNERESDATAIPQRDSILKLVYSASWIDPAEDDKHLTFVREWYRDVHAGTGGVPISNGITDGTYMNNPDTDLMDPRWNTSGVPWYSFYYKDNYPRLQRIKAAWDPRNVFHHALSIQAPDTEA
ncbi:FAD-binding oxidoreductase [Kitasatospora sp. NBC_01266]|uniref:FAD-binding oxidoreductase n=1 Tax=Kitasatospora sp. NBC_01266 TaxID=2903572 RepID=UPI002E2ED547|nr:FAD-binding protein [Kitasatospora sp. NBC_01266]